MQEKSYKTFAYPVKTVKSSKYIPACANNSFDSESTEASRTFWDRRCPRMSLVHLAITTLVTLAGLSILQPHVPPAICPYSQEAMSRKHLLYHAYSSISELVQTLRTVWYCKFHSGIWTFHRASALLFLRYDHNTPPKTASIVKNCYSWTQRAPHYGSGNITALFTCDMALHSRYVFWSKYKLLWFPARKSSLR